MPLSPPVREPQPGRQERTGRHLAAQQTRPGPNGADSTDTYLGERHARIDRRRGKAKAMNAVARSILVIIWHLLKDPENRYTDLGYGY